ncbi:MAG: hypothetical protein ACOYNS_14605 [Bacteroidota bacterium]
MRTLFIILSSSLLIFGCSGSESSSHRRGKLSDAVDAASDRNSGDRTVRADFEEPSPENDTPPLSITIEKKKESKTSGFSDTAASPSYQYVPNPRSKQEYLDSVYRNGHDDHSLIQMDSSETIQSFSVGLNASSGFLSSNEFYGMTSFGLNVSGELEQGVIGEIGADMTFAPLQRTSKLSHSIEDGIVLFDLNFQLRFPTTPEYTFIGQYFLLGGGVNIMLWSYKNPIKAPVYSADGSLRGYDQIDSDQLNGINLFTGIGFDLTQSLPVHLIIEVKPGVIIWTGTTTEGFDNDIFANFAYLQVGVKLNFGDR